ncbi:hypothetical protein CXB42_15025 [Pseudomonas syringae pv. syringae]|uniref:DUF1534 domain-containing protein n=1 Tax=Pseudomonas syringae pv. syringae TaxID=321 RepID=A0AAE5S6B5_PSESY|nr:hypothetical protein CXB42_15025 [Pseudomonas syringae pv. syringae]
MGVPFVTLCVTDLSRCADSGSKRSVQNCMPTQSVGTIASNERHKSVPRRSLMVRKAIRVCAGSWRRFRK